MAVRCRSYVIRLGAALVLRNHFRRLVLLACLGFLVAISVGLYLSASCAMRSISSLRSPAAVVGDGDVVLPPSGLLLR